LQAIAGNKEFDCVTTNEATRFSNDERSPSGTQVRLEENSHYGITRKVRDLAQVFELYFRFFLFLRGEVKVIGSSDQEHVVDALAMIGDERRGSLRKASGSWQTSIEPEISEWGNPPAKVSLPEYIGR